MYIYMYKTLLYLIEVSLFSYQNLVLKSHLLMKHLLHSYKSRVLIARSFWHQTKLSAEMKANLVVLPHESVHIVNVPFLRLLEYSSQHCLPNPFPDMHS